jgi:hypothetical protein
MSDQNSGDREILEIELSEEEHAAVHAEAEALSMPVAGVTLMRLLDMSIKDGDKYGVQLYSAQAHLEIIAEILDALDFEQLTEKDIRDLSVKIKSLSAFATTRLVPEVVWEPSELAAAKRRVTAN